jgi:hypothetical protein
MATKRTKRRTRIRRGGGSITYDDKEKLSDALLSDDVIINESSEFKATHTLIKKRIISEDPARLLIVDPNMEHFYDDLLENIKPIYEKLKA